MALNWPHMANIARILSESAQKCPVARIPKVGNLANEKTTM